MKTTLSALMLSLFLVLAGAPAAAADTGRIDLAPLASEMAAKPKVNINFGPAMMAGFAETMRESNPEMAGVLASVSGLRLMVYEGVDSTAAEPQVASLIDRLGSDGWSPAIMVQDDETSIDLYLKESDEFVTGLLLLLRDGDDAAVFANIHGEMDPVVIGKLIGSGQAMNGLDLDGLMNQIQGEGDTAPEEGDGQ